MVYAPAIEREMQLGDLLRLPESIKKRLQGSKTLSMTINFYLSRLLGRSTSWSVACQFISSHKIALH